MQNFQLIFGWIFIISGCFFLISSAFGVIRFSDFFIKIHVACVGDSCAIPLILFGIAIQNGFTQFSMKLILLILFIFITSPTSCHALAKSAIISNILPKNDD